MVCIDSLKDTDKTKTQTLAVYSVTLIGKNHVASHELFQELSIHCFKRECHLFTFQPINAYALVAQHVIGDHYFNNFE